MANKALQRHSRNFHHKVKISVQETASSRVGRTLKNRFPPELRVATVLNTFVFQS